MQAVLPYDPDTAYALVSDVVATARLSDELVELGWDERADAGRVSVGDRFTSHHSVLGMIWSSTSTVTCADPGRRFVFAVNGPEHPTAIWTFDLRPEPAGDRTRVVYRVELGDGPSMFGLISGGDPDRHRQAVSYRLDSLAAGMRVLLDHLAGHGPARELPALPGGS